MNATAIIAAATASGATVMTTPAGTVIFLATRTASPDDLLPLADTAREAATSLRVVKDAVRTGELPAVGRQRDRAVRRRDLSAWVDTRRAPIGKVDDGQEARVERRLARAKAA